MSYLKNKISTELSKNGPNDDLKEFSKVISAKNSPENF
jgi:hypothetical protein